jgi:hypothetical protein
MDTKPLACWICGKAVNLNTCKTDEHGLTVHEECYVARIKSWQKQRSIASALSTMRKRQEAS